jgi:hypothetical protein
MTHLGALLALTGAVAFVLVGLGRAATSYNQEDRQILRGLRNVLKGEIQAYLIDHDHGRGIGFNFTNKTMAVTWNAGEWCLIYRIEELLGMELIVDDWVTGWAFARESHALAEARAGANENVGLRLVFADPQYADFGLVLWSEEAGASSAPNAREAIEIGNRWLTNMHRLLNRASAPAAPRPDPAPRREMPSFRTLADS